MPMFRMSTPPDLLGAVRSSISNLNSDADARGRARSTRMAAAARRMFERSGGELSALDEMRADQAAADTAHKLSLVEKVRSEVERQNQAEALRRDPTAQTQYAADVALLDTPTGTQTYRALRGERDPNPQGFEDASGNLYGDVPVSLPKLQPGQLERFQHALAALQANRLATGTTSAEQLAAAGGHLQKQDLVAQAANAPDVETGNRLVAAIAGKMREPYAVGADGQVLNQETGGVDESTLLAQAAHRQAAARATSDEALVRNRDAHADLYRAQTGKTGLEAKRIERELSGADEGLPAQAFRKVTGAKLSDLPQDVRLQWIQNHAAGMTPEQNLAALRQAARRDALLAEARQVYESQYPKTMMGQRTAGAPDFLSFAEQYVAQKEGGARVPQPGGGGREVRGRISGPGSAQQPARPKTQAEYDALPSGAIFIDPDDGQTYRKP